MFIFKHSQTKKQKNEKKKNNGEQPLEIPSGNFTEQENMKIYS